MAWKAHAFTARRMKTLLAMAALAAAVAAPAVPGGGPEVQPLTTIGADGAGYLTDPQPIRLAPSTGNHVQYLSGTTKAVIACAYPLRARCFNWTPISVDAAGLRPAMQSAGVTITNIQNVDIFQGDDGHWHAAVTVGVHSATHPKHWTVVAHAHPAEGGDPAAPPLAWHADTVLAGSLQAPDTGNYDGKYYEEDGHLYLLYVRTIAPAPALRNAIVLQPMDTFTQAAGTATILLTPGDRYGELNSEWFGNTQAKLVEAPWLIRIGDKHALIYSTGSYLTPGYKAAVAWSDTLMPAQNGRYRKVLAEDRAGIWGSAGGRDVRYLVQSAKPRWPNFIGGEVVGPGVAAVVHGEDGHWRLFFNGFAPDDMPATADGKVDGTHRRPYAIDLHVNVPSGASVRDASDEELATWMRPAPR